MRIVPLGAVGARSVCAPPMALRGGRRAHARSRGRLLAAAGLALAGWSSLAVSADVRTVQVQANPVSPAAAQAAVPRPRLGLVLGGGGARGMAHIGVLKVLESLRVPVDVVTGTSMGSIVGGVFATGMTATEMERRVLAVDWNVVFDDRIDRANLSMRRKEDSRASLFRPEFGLRDGKIQLPVGAIAGRRLDLLLHDLTLPATRQVSFDDLAIPFRAIATDLVTGDMVVQRGGFLAQAVRASMSVPGAFDPVEIDGRLLVDGGLVRNVPVDIARDMGAEVVIAVDVGALNRTRPELDSLTAVLDQMVNINIRRNADASLASLAGRDVKITPDLGTVGSADFPRAADAIAAGEKAARAVADQLAAFSVSPEAYARWQRSLERSVQDVERYDFVEIVGPQRVNPKALLSTMATRPGDIVTGQQLNDDLERLQARGEFEYVEARTIEDDRGQGLRMKFTEKRWGPNIMKLGLSLNSDVQGDSAYELGARYTRTWINELGGELRGEAAYGRLRRVYGELYQPLDLDGLVYVRPYAGAQRNTVNLFQGHQRIAVYDVQDVFTGFDIGHQLFKWADVSVGARYSSSQALPIIGLPNYPTVQTPYGGYTWRAVYDQFDNFFFPTTGAFVEAKGLMARPSLGSNESTNLAQASFSQAWSQGRSSWVAGFEAGRVYNVDPNSLQSLTLGGLFRLSGLRTEELRGPKMALGRVIYSYRLDELPSMLGGNVFIGGSAEVGNVWHQNETMSTSNVVVSGSIYFGADTAAGPLYLAFGKAAGNVTSLYVYLGRPF